MQPYLDIQNFCILLLHVVALHKGGRDSALALECHGAEQCHRVIIGHQKTMMNINLLIDHTHFTILKIQNLLTLCINEPKPSCTKHKLLEFSKKWPIPFQENPSRIAYWEQTNEVIPSILSTSPKGVLSP